MKKYVRNMFLVCALGIIVVLTTTCSTVFYQMHKDTLNRYMHSIISAVCIADLQATDAADIVETLGQEDPHLYVSVFDQGGNILRTNESSVAANPPEVQAALQGGWGEAGRIMKGEPYFYVAYHVSDNAVLRVGYASAEFRSVLNAILITAAIVAALSLLLVNGVAARIANHMVRPLRKLNDMLDGTSELHPAGEEKLSFPEAQSLIDNIGAMISKLKYDFKEIEETQQLRKDFIANASHELKSPLTSIKGFAELLSTGMVPEEDKQQEYLQRIVTESDRLLAIIEDILHLSRAESGAIENVSTVDLKAMTQEIFKALELFSQKKSIHLEVAGECRVTANSEEMWEMIYNLVDNAIRYGREGGYVNVRLDGKSIVVVDNGIGIPEEQLPRIFERFYRVDKSRSRATGGTGLGLSIVRHIAQKYGGDVFVNSRNGDGTMFTVKLKV